MRILVIGGQGTIGKKVVSFLSKNHNVITAGRKNGEIYLDLSDEKSIKKLFENNDKFDAVICIAGQVIWAPFSDLSKDDYYIGIKNKMMGQVNLVQIGQNYITKGGSLTLTTGILADKPVKMTTGAALVNGAIHSFVKAVILEIKNNIRVNVVSPGLVKDSEEKYGDYFPGYNVIPMQKLAETYSKIIEGTKNGEVIRVYD
ncbi:MAG: short chain dehydrogenase [Bacteroidota bacterium]|nr:short chain dehydrogenase [Bacteroidota bacterium]